MRRGQNSVNPITNSIRLGGWVAEQMLIAADQDGRAGRTGRQTVLTGPKFENGIKVKIVKYRIRGTFYYHKSSKKCASHFLVH